MSTQAAVMTASMSPVGRRCLTCCKGEKSDKGVTRFPQSIVYLATLGGVIVSIAAIVSSDLLLADLTGALLIGFCPYVAYQKRQLLKLDTFRGALNEMRENVNEFMRQNNVLTHNVDELSKNVGELEEVEGNLTKLANTDNVDRLKEVVLETKSINSQMKKIMEASIIQQMITTVIRTDRDLDLKIGPTELKRLMMRLDQKPGFDFNEDKFISLLGDTSQPVPMEKIMDVIRNLKNPRLKKEDSVFVLHPESLAQ